MTRLAMSRVAFIQQAVLGTISLYVVLIYPPNWKADAYTPDLYRYKNMKEAQLACVRDAEALAKYVEFDEQGEVSPESDA